MGGSKTYPYGSTAGMRADTLAVLGVLKVATASQIQRLMRPGAVDNKVARNALLDLKRHGLVLSEGSTSAGHKLWGLTPLGLDAAAEVLPTGTALGGTARGAGRSGAPHAMAVNETVLALIQPRPENGHGQDDGDPQGQGQDRAGPGTPAGATDPPPPGIGSIYAITTEAVHNLPSTSRNKNNVRADAVLRAPEADLPVLLVEVDRGTETPARVAAKFDTYRQFFRLTTKDHTGRDRPVWRTMYPDTGHEGYPPIAIVFTGRLGPKALHSRILAVGQLTRDYWQGRYQGDPAWYSSGANDSYDDYSDAIPILATTLTDLQAEGPHGTIWLRYGHRRPETIPQALANHNDKAAYYQHAEDRIRQRREEEQRKREEERLTLEEAWQTPDNEDDEEDPASAEPCQRCHRLIDGPVVPGSWADTIPPQDGLHCPSCRADLAAEQPPPGLFRALFGRRTT